MTTDLTAALTDLAQASAPPSSIDAARARAAGRRRMRLRKAAWTSGIITVALAATLTPAALMIPVDPSPAASDPPAVDRSRSPLVSRVEFGWLPSYFGAVSYNEGYHGVFADARGTEPTGHVGEFGLMPTVVLSAYPRGTEPTPDRLVNESLDLPTPNPPRWHQVPAPAVNKRPAYWVTEDAADPLNGGDIHLRWQVARDQWVEIHAYYLPDDAPKQEVVLRIAAAARVGDRAVPMPFYITGMPAGFELDEANLLRRPFLPGGPPWSAGLLYFVPGTTYTLGIGVSPTAPQEPSRGKTCWTVDAFDLCITAVNGVPPALDAIGGLEGLRSRITILGSDDRNWTTDVLR
ncbi:hypothetical protein [Virgisporangium aurantiacum]|uniref:Uncharacterized protein n=1 Tax=Virgisporangium aurantiacum TaxID=175570 RepID=A0A8J3ZJ00_9ACTN|nr:hypothetical protein [Virgisporangium aurantiacum]GIJ62303.1 hypothetical protein Vau01_098190 [Virgisporangium aurantiacum]